MFIIDRSIFSPECQNHESRTKTVLSSLLSYFGNRISENGVRVAMIHYDSKPDVVFDFNGISTNVDYDAEINFLVDNMRFNAEVPLPQVHLALQLARESLFGNASSGSRASAQRMYVVLAGEIFDGFAVVQEAVQLQENDMRIVYDGRPFTNIDPLLPESIQQELQQEIQNRNVFTQSALTLIAGSEENVLNLRCADEQEATFDSTETFDVLDRILG